MAQHKLTTVYGLRLDKETYDLIGDVARRRGIDLADLIRELIRKELARLGYLSPEDQQALGMKNQAF